jgi:hypothetical protein
MHQILAHLGPILTVKTDLKHDYKLAMKRSKKALIRRLIRSLLRQVMKVPTFDNNRYTAANSNY